MSAAMLRAITVAVAAPATSIRGIGPHPKIKIGSRQRLSNTVKNCTFNGVTVSPNPWRSACITKKKNIRGIPEKMIRM